MRRRGGGSRGGNTNPPATTQSIGGVVNAPAGVALVRAGGRTADAMGLVNRVGVTVSAYLVDDHGVKTGSILATGTTDVNGAFTMAIPASVSLGPNLIFDAGPSSDPMRAFVTKASTAITPLTELVMEHVAASGKLISNMSAAKLNAIQNQVNTDAATIDLSGATTVSGCISILDTGTVKSNMDAMINDIQITPPPGATATVTASINPTTVALSNGSARVTLTCTTTATAIEARCKSTSDWATIAVGNTKVCAYTAAGTYIPGCRINGATVASVDTPVVVTAAQPAGGGQYIVLAWNDLGMHCLNPSYDTAVILPPYNTVHAQVILRGNPPQVVTSGLTIDYKITNNSYSYGKRSYGQFWDNAQALFGGSPARNFGLNLEDPGISNGLTGSMISKGNNFQVNGIPLTPVDDSNVWNPYQVIELTVSLNGTQVAATKATIPTSDEINCAKCHGADTFNDILTKHDSLQGTTLISQKPVLCAKCHGSPALGQSGPGSSGKYLSQAIHGFHATKGAACYDCHPGNTTKCNRSIAHTATDGNCTTCHGDMANVASTITSGSRIPWANEPKCSNCHSATIPQVDTGSTLYRNAQGHGSLFCAACHGSPHAMVPSSQASDNYQAIQYMGKAKSIGTCSVCHNTSKGEGSSDFAEEHGAGGRLSACNVCHTGFTNLSTANWPHAFQWKSRP